MPKKQKHSVILILLLAVFVSVIAVACILNYSAAAQNNRDAAKADREYARISRENKENKDFLENDDHSEYYEQVAREQYDYGKPGERVYFYETPNLETTDDAESEDEETSEEETSDEETSEEETSEEETTQEETSVVEPTEGVSSAPDSSEN